MRPPCRLLAAIGLLALLSTPGFARSEKGTPLDRILVEDASLAPLRAAVQADPSAACLWNEIGKTLARRAYFDEAQEAFERSLKLASDAVVWTNLGSLHLSRGRFGPARSALNKAIALNPNLALAWYHLGATDEAQYKYEGAVKNYRRAFELDPKLADPMLNPAVVNNAYMTAIRTLLYQDTVGALSLPLSSTCGGATASTPPAASQPVAQPAPPAAPPAPATPPPAKPAPQAKPAQPAPQRPAPTPPPA